MANVEVEKVIQDLATKLANAESRESMVRIYSEQLEEQIAVQTERIKVLEEERRGMVKDLNTKAVGKADAA